MVTVKSLSFAYNKRVPIFSDFNWTIKPGERWSVIGPSGCGKTTLLYLLAGLRVPSSGQITISDGLGPHKVQTGLVLQDYGLLPWATAFQNVALGLKIQKTDRTQVNEMTQKWLVDLGIESVSSHYPSELSGGQRQRVAIARTLIMQPSLLLMDEPFASLDTLTREDLLDLTLTLWRKQPSTMVLVTHNIEEAVYWGSHIMVLQKAPNTRGDLIENPDSGNAEYREQPGYRALCRQLRGLIEKYAGSTGDRQI
ncbi:MAG TPA: ATP-binding cassette domain-containing protein [Dehalococcoidales bacterium]|nr:ATP-binding cassette domain-containing protein [Dehalococcoidales bacterium]